MAAESLNHFIRPQQHRLRDREAEALAVFMLMTSSNRVGCPGEALHQPEPNRVSANPMLLLGGGPSGDLVLGLRELG
jgi:hypothetical protein